MTDRQRLSLFVAITFVVLAAPSPAAFTTDTMTLVPAGEMLAALDLDQGDRDPACVAECAARRDKLTAEAARQLQGKEFYSKFDSNCFSYEGLPMCAALRAQCQAGCGPKATASCLASCESAFQSCCATNKTTAAERDYSACLTKCPVVKKPAPVPATSPEPRAATRDTGTTAPADKKRALADLLQSVNKLVDALGPSVDALGLERFNDLRRSLAFAQVSVSMAEHGAKYAVVSGGGGRLWINLAGGKQIPLDDQLSLTVRGRATSPDWGREEDRTRTELMRLTGLSSLEVMALISDVRGAENQGAFAPGAVLEFPPSTGWPRGALASVEHASIKGTINGGGDFI